MITNRSFESDANQRGAAHGSPGRPNILFILADQWHPRCVGYAGHPILRTPHIDQLAAGGAAFSRMYSPSPLCMPARASIFTGLTPRGHRVRTNGIPLDPSIPTFVDALRGAGYHTHGVGKMHFSISTQPNGVPADELDPAQYPECRTLWNSGRIDRLPLPFYGFEQVEYASGHGHHVVGDYVAWLRAEHPEMVPVFEQPGMLEEPTPAYRLANRRSFKWALPASLHPTTWVVQRCIDFLGREAAARERSAGRRPFFLYCGINDPHSPFAPPTPYGHAYDPADVPAPLARPGELDDLPPHFRAMVEQGIVTSGNPGEAMALTRPHARECTAHYFGQIQLIDDQLGQLLATLRKTGLERDTLVIFTADHGEALGDHGLWGKGPYHYDAVIRVPFVASWPGQIPASLQIDTPCSLLDLGPTCLELAGVAIPGDCPVQPPEAPAAPPAWPGRSLTAKLFGRAEYGDGTALVEMDEDYLGLKLRTLVTRRHRLTMYSGQDYGELFDLATDPEEYHNLWHRPEHRQLRERLALQLLDLIIRLDISVPRQVARA